MFIFWNNNCNFYRREACLEEGNEGDKRATELMRVIHKREVDKINADDEEVEEGIDDMDMLDEGEGEEDEDEDEDDEVL